MIVFFKEKFGLADVTLSFSGFLYFKTWRRSIEWCTRNSFGLFGKAIVLKFKWLSVMLLEISVSLLVGILLLYPRFIYSAVSNRLVSELVFYELFDSFFSFYNISFIFYWRLKTFLIIMLEALDSRGTCFIWPRLATDISTYIFCFLCSSLIFIIILWFWEQSINYYFR